MKKIIQKLIIGTGLYYFINFASTYYFLDSSSVLVDIINECSLLVLISILISAIMDTKSYLEYGGGSINNKEEKVVNDNVPDIETTKPKYHDIKTYNALIKVDEVIDINVIYLLREIENKMSIIDSFPLLKNDTYHRINFLSIRQHYLPKIINNYLAVPETLRINPVEDGENITTLTVFQLNLLLDELKKIEAEAIKGQVSEARIMKNFLKKKFHNKDILELAELERQVNL